FGIHDPIFPHPMRRVEPTFYRLIAPSILSSGRHDFHNQVGRSGKLAFPYNLLPSFARNKSDVWNHGVMIAKDGSCSTHQSAERHLIKVSEKRFLNVVNNQLVLNTRCSRHE